MNMSTNQLDTQLLKLSLETRPMNMLTNQVDTQLLLKSSLEILPMNMSKDQHANDYVKTFIIKFILFLL